MPDQSSGLTSRAIVFVDNWPSSFGSLGPIRLPSDEFGPASGTDSGSDCPSTGITAADKPRRVSKTVSDAFLPASGWDWSLVQGATAAGLLAIDAAMPARSGFVTLGTRTPGPSNTSGEWPFAGPVPAVASPATPSFSQSKVVAVVASTIFASSAPALLAGLVTEAFSGNNKDKTTASAEGRAARPGSGVRVVAAPDPGPWPGCSAFVR